MYAIGNSVLSRGFELLFTFTFLDVIDNRSISFCVSFLMLISSLYMSARKESIFVKLLFIDELTLSGVAEKAFGAKRIKAKIKIEKYFIIFT